MERIAAWNAYWSSGALHSCAGSFGDNYEGEIREFWREVFRPLAEPARVLDLCCGNAPLTRLLFELDAWRDGIRIVAADAARIAPPWIDALGPKQRAAIEVLPGTDAAKLPLADASIDLCISQYGIEYVGAEAVHEVARVLRPGARFAAVLHHADSLPVRMAREELAHQAMLRAPDGLLAAVDAMIEPMARSATESGRATLRADVDANRRRESLNASLQALQQRVEASRWPDALVEMRDATGAVLGLARERGEEAARALLQRRSVELDTMRLRQHELVECALDEPALRALLRPLAGASADMHLDVLRFSTGDIAGWTVQCQPTTA